MKFMKKHHINNGTILRYTISECTRNHTMKSKFDGLSGRSK